MANNAIGSGPSNSSSTSTSTSAGNASRGNPINPDCIRLANQQTRSHPLWPVLDYIAKTTYHNQQQIDAIKVKLDKETSKIAQMQQELADLVKQYGKNAYKLSDEGFDVQLRTGMAALFCSSIDREISDESI
jgi:hypothetical protein